MSRFKVSVTEILNRDIIIEAKDLKEATDSVAKKYENCDIVLGGDDCVSAEIHGIQIALG